MVYTLNRGGSLAPSPGDYGSVTLTNYGAGASAYVQVDVELKPGFEFRGYRCRLCHHLEYSGHAQPRAACPPATRRRRFQYSTALPANFVLQDQGVHPYDALGGQTFSASPFGAAGEYAIYHDVHGNSGTAVYVVDI